MADFALTQMTALPALDIGTAGNGAAASVEISVTTDMESYPHAISLRHDGFSDGIGLRVDPDVITPTIAGVTTTVWISASQYMYNGVYTATLRGFGGGAAHTLHFSPTVIAPEFALNASTGALALDAAGASLTVSAVGINGHVAAIQLDALEVPFSVEAAFDDDTITAGQQTTLRFSGTPLTASGVHTITLRCDDGPNRHELELTLTVVVPDFVITPQAAQLRARALNGAPTERTIYPGEDAVFTLDVSFADGWNQPVTLQAAPNFAPSGAGIGLTLAGASAQAAAASPSQSITLNGDGTVKLHVATLAATPAGLYLLPLQADSAGVSKVNVRGVRLISMVMDG